MVGGVRVLHQGRVGKATPLTTTVVGSMSVTGMKLGVVVGDPKTKIGRLAGVVALMLKGANGVPTPIWVVTVLTAGIGSGDQPALDDLAPPAMRSPRILRDVVARRPDDEVGVVIAIDRDGLVP